MCDGVPLFADNKKALYGKKTTSHSTAAEMLKIDEDKFRKYEYWWWEKKIVDEHYDETAEEIVRHIDKNKADKLVKNLVKKELSTQIKLAKWLKGVPSEWGRLMKPEFYSLAKKVNPKLVFYHDKITKFKKEKIEKYNPYKATKLPKLEAIKKAIPVKVRDQVGDQVRDQVWDQVGGQVRGQVGGQVWGQVWDQVWGQVWDQVWDQVGGQVWDQVRGQVWDQVRDQVGGQVWDQVRGQVDSVSYWAIKVVLGLPIKHWFFDWLKLGIMVVFVQGKVKVFGKKGKFLGEYDRKEFDK